MKILLVRKLGRNSMTLKLNISLRPFDLLCTSAEKLGFSSFDCFFLFFSLNCFNLHSSERFANGPGAWKWRRMKRLHGFNPSGPEMLKVKLDIKCDYLVLDTWFSQILFWHSYIKGQDAEKQRENNIAEQDLRRSLKSYWPKKCLFRNGNFLLPPGKGSRRGCRYIFGQTQLRTPSDPDLKWSHLNYKVQGKPMTYSCSEVDLQTPPCPSWGLF